MLMLVLLLQMINKLKLAGPEEEEAVWREVQILSQLQVGLAELRCSRSCLHQWRAASSAARHWWSTRPMKKESAFQWSSRLLS